MIAKLERTRRISPSQKRIKQESSTEIGATTNNESKTTNLPPLELTAADTTAGLVYILLAESSPKILLLLKRKNCPP